MLSSRLISSMKKLGKGWKVKAIYANVTKSSIESVACLSLSFFLASFVFIPTYSCTQSHTLLNTHSAPCVECSKITPRAHQVASILDFRPTVNLKCMHMMHLYTLGNIHIFLCLHIFCTHTVQTKNIHRIVHDMCYIRLRAECITSTTCTRKYSRLFKKSCELCFEMKAFAIDMVCDTRKQLYSMMASVHFAFSFSQALQKERNFARLLNTNVSRVQFLERKRRTN